MTKQSKTSFRADVGLAEQIENFVYEVVLLGENSPLKDNERKNLRLVTYDDDPETQMTGGDIVYKTSQQQDIIIDVKFASYYAGYHGEPRLETFAQELSFEKDKQRRPGWLINPDNQTSVYAFGWVNSVTEDTPRRKNKYRRVTRFGQITDCEIAFVRKDALLKAVAKYLGKASGATQVSEDTVVGYLRALDAEARCSREKTFEFNQDSLLAEPSLGYMRVHYTETLEEKPVNLLFPRKILCSKEVAFCHLHCKKKPDGTWSISDGLLAD